VLYDGNTADAPIHDLEYIISERRYNTLAADAKAYWHPHNYEILSGQLRMPGLPDAAENEALKGKMNSYGKTWHVWMTGMYGQSPDDLPIGPAHLAWSFNHDGEDAPGMVDARDKRMGLNTAEAPTSGPTSFHLPNRRAALRRWQGTSQARRRYQAFAAMGTPPRVPYLRSESRRNRAAPPDSSARAGAAEPSRDVGN
jgi:hypothetical protein